MAALTVAAVRQRIATLADALTGWSESKVPYDRFGFDPNSVGHLRFAVGVPSTAATGERQRATRGAWVRTTAAVRFLHRIKPKDQVTSYDAALGAELDLIQAVMAEGTATQQDCQILLDSVPLRQVPDPGEWFLGEVQFTVSHRLALQ